MAATLEAVRSDVAPFSVGVTSGGETPRAYAFTLSDAGIARVGEDPAAVLARVRDSNIRPTLIAALDHWQLTADDQATKRWVQEVVVQLDPSPDAWQRRVRSPDALADPASCSQLAAAAPFEGGSLPLLVSFGQALAVAARRRRSRSSRASRGAPGRLLGEPLSVRSTLSPPSRAGHHRGNPLRAGRGGNTPWLGRGPLLPGYLARVVGARGRGGRRLPRGPRV